MKITLEPYSGGVYTAQNDAEHIDEVVKSFKCLLVSCGYHPETVDKYFITEEEWFPEQPEKPDKEMVDNYLQNLYDPKT